MKYRAVRTRENSSDGAGHVGLGQTNMGLSDSLITSVLGSEYATPRKKPKAQKIPGMPKAASLDFPEAVFLEARRLYEQTPATYEKVHEALTAKGVVITRKQVVDLVQYKKKIFLIPPAYSKPYL